MAGICNVAAYRFAPLDHLKELRARLLGRGRELALRGTILLSPEGINLFVAGARENVEELLAEIRRVPGLEDLQGKLSESGAQPFNRMLVRIKKEIIAFGVPGIDPARQSSRKVSPKTLRQWLDEGRPVTLLDTRNDYEIKLGTFRDAVPAGIDHFREFPEAVRRLPESLKEGPVVMFCTGGIRCEKAGPFMEREGFKNVYQLEGGILKYFEECGSAHYDGECFVFDQRVGVDASLAETESAQCFKCLSPLTAEEQRDGRYVPGKSCPYCFKTPAEEMVLKIARRHEAMRRVTTPLPGSTPYDNLRPVSVPGECDGATVTEFLGKVLRHMPSAELEEAMDCERIVNAGGVPVRADARVRAGERYFHKLCRTVEPEVNARIEILHEDEAIIVLNKPAPLPMHPSGRYNRNTLQHILNLVYAPEKPRPAHRLDANTTGIVLVTRTRHFASLLQPRFARGEIAKTYLARVQGHPAKDCFTCEEPISCEPGETGTRGIDFEEGLAARTDFTVLARFDDGTALLEARPHTGRTNQIRVHLWNLGTPVCGDAVYLRGRTRGSKQTLGVDDPPLCLHAWRLEFPHPVSGARMSFSAAVPAHFNAGGKGEGPKGHK